LPSIAERKKEKKMRWPRSSPLSSLLLHVLSLEQQRTSLSSREDATRDWPRNALERKRRNTGESLWCLLSRSRDRIVWREIYFFHFPSSIEFVFFRFSQKRNLLAFRLGACKASTRRQSSIDGRRPAPSDDGGDAGTSETRREEEEHPIASTPFVLLRRPSTPPPFSKMESFAAYFLPDFHLGAHAQDRGLTA
jgi:hypothetical protein